MISKFPSIITSKGGGGGGVIVCHSENNREFKYTVEFQWLEHRWLVYHGYFELVLESQGKKSHSCRHYYIWENLGGFLFYIDNGMFCVLIRIASMRRF